MNTSLILAFAAPAALALATTTPAADSPFTGDSCSTAATAESNTIVDIALADPQFSTLVTALGAADLVTTLQGEGPFTVFAPTNDAFDKLPAGTLTDLLKPENVDTLTSILTYHVVGGTLDAAGVTTSFGAVSLQGQQVDFEARSLQTARGKVTRVFADQAEIVVTDIVASNGIIHVIDDVLLPATADIVETAQSAGVFNTLIAAATAADLVPLLTGDGPLTVLAPTDDAFAALPAGTVESLLKPENKGRLVSILKLHVIEGRFYANDVFGASEVKPLGNKRLTIRKGEGKVNVEGANIVTPDIDASNGVIHIIDAVIL